MCSSDLAPVSGASPPASTFATNNLARSPRACVLNGTSLTGPVQLLQVIEARYRGKRAYIGVFLRDGVFPDALVVSVVSKNDCTLLTRAEQRLP